MVVKIYMIFRKSHVKNTGVLLLKNNLYYSLQKQYLNALVAAEVEIKLGGMRNTEVDGGTGGYVTRFTRLLLFIGTEQPCVVPLLYHYERNARLVVCLQLGMEIIIC